MMHFVKLRHLRPGNKPKSSASTRDTELDEARLWYYGTSYGTLLGQTLAALFPDQIGRMILDGNVDGIQHYTGVQPADVDATDAAFHEFFAKCFAAGPEKCAYHNDAASVDEIENRYVILLRDLRTMPAIWDMASDYGVLTADVVASIMFRAMYSPLDTWEQLAVFLRAMQDGRPIEAFEAASSILRGHLQAPAKRKSPDAMQIITCLDADEKFATISSTLEKFIKKRAFSLETRCRSEIFSCVWV
jgi:pimeloyl-ACP methyl ester carboxylesterase